VNTGWTGNPYGESDRIRISYSRAIVRNILNGALGKSEFRQDPHFGFMVPGACEGVPSEIMDPAAVAHSRAEYEERARKLVRSFQDNYQQFRR
jgi:phosphoenolpyruvate carboxykinase (ATP)